ncbi:MAG: cell wall metabolism sensor histidine kinase WalK [Clostridia bacterium]|jgi:two-component system sensor histidine kinase VicK|nr:cell wall metabolism sensor histidine kinase WalK [Clostridia bacterium]
MRKSSKKAKMLKNIQLKIILVFFIVGILIILGLGGVFTYGLGQIQIQISALEANQEIIQLIQAKEEEVKILVAILGITFIFVSILVGIFVSKGVIKPITRLIKNAKRIAAGEEFEIKSISKGKGDSEINDLINAFGMMTAELKENLNEVSRQKNQIETILLHMTDGIVAFNMEGKIILINPAATRLLRIMPEDENFEKIFKKLNLDINMEKKIYLEDWTSSEQRVTIGDKVITLFFASFKDEKERPAGVMIVIQDITEHVKLDNMRKEFVADVSHELKTPITSIMGYADTLLEGEYEKETQDKFLNVIASEARRMAKLVTDLLTLSRYDNNQVKTEKQEFDLGELVKKCQEKLQLEIDKKHQEIECFVTANVPLVSADKYGIERVVLNILTNSIKYTKEKGHIKIYVGFVYNDAYIKIIDNGVGIPEEDLTKIFERFYRVDKARTREMGGTGLGLSIAKEILDKNNGSIDIKSKVGEGTEVVIRVPTVQ